MSAELNPQVKIVVVRARRLFAGSDSSGLGAGDWESINDQGLVKETLSMMQQRGQNSIVHCPSSGN